jgi:hypothetical protein
MTTITESAGPSVAGGPPFAGRGRSRFAIALVSVVALVGLVAAIAVAGTAPQTSPGDPLDPRTYDPGSRQFLALDAIGVQKYACQANGTWLFTDPVATLSNTGGAKVMHFLNFATGRPVWQAKDGSSVEAARLASASGGAGNIAQLLLRQADTNVGSDGDRLAATEFVQRLNTSGGVAPAGVCTPGDRVAVPYTATYTFWTSGAANA